MKRIILIFLALCSMLSVTALDTVDSLEVSVITCSPGEEVYSLYGHTAIRVRDFRSGKDYVFNYGVFDFAADNFVWKFVLGETDYMCAAAPWAYFVKEYEMRGSSVTAQVLNLTSMEARRCVDMLMNNIREENCIYRYNYLTCNCTTRVRDMVESAVDGDIIYSGQPEPRTYRQIMHEYTLSSPWAQEGNDVLLGADVDTLLSERAKNFVPEYYYKALEGAVVIKPNCDTRRLVRVTEILIRQNPVAVSASHSKSQYPNPILVGWGVLVFFVLLALVEIKVRKVFLVLDIPIMLAHGAAGCVILFVFLFSEHPTLDSNWQVWVLNPLPLLAMPYIAKAVWHDVTSRWHYVMFALMALFLLFLPWIPQCMPVLTVPVTLALMTRYASQIYILTRRKH